MATYREQLLKETYGKDYRSLYPQEEPGELPGFFWFKIRFTVCLILFAVYGYLSFTGMKIGRWDAAQIAEAVCQEELEIDWEITQ